MASSSLPDCSALYHIVSQNIKLKVVNRDPSSVFLDTLSVVCHDEVWCNVMTVISVMFVMFRSVLPTLPQLSPLPDVPQSFPLDATVSPASLAFKLKILSPGDPEADPEDSTCSAGTECVQCRCLPLGCDCDPSAEDPNSFCPSGDVCKVSSDLPSLSRAFGGGECVWSGGQSVV